MTVYNRGDYSKPSACCTITLMDGTNQTPNTDSPWQYQPDDNAAQFAPQSLAPTSVASPPAGPDGTISWTASEFIAHSKTSGWFGLLALGAILATVVVWFLTKDIVSIVFILFAAVAFGVFAVRQPREAPIG